MVSGWPSHTKNGLESANVMPAAAAPIDPTPSARASARAPSAATASLASATSVSPVAVSGPSRSSRGKGEKSPAFWLARKLVPQASYGFHSGHSPLSSRARM